MRQNLNKDLPYKNDKCYVPIIKDGNIIDIKFLYKPFIDVLLKMGFRLFDPNRPFVFVKLTDNIIEEYSISQIQKYFIDYIEKHHKPYDNVKKSQIVEKIYKSPGHYFSDTRLSLLYSSEPIKLHKDTRDTIYLYYKNGYVKSTAENISFNEYATLDKPIWDSHINDRSFRSLNFTISHNEDELGYFYKFLKNISGNKNRLISLMSLIGYLLHNYFNYDLKAVVYTDSKLLEEADGRSGKSLLGKAIGMIKKVEYLNGKDFTTDSKHKYQTLTIDCHILWIDDLKRNFDVETLFNDITEGVSIEQKNMNPKKSRVKIALTTNRTLKIEGGSAKARFVEFELTDHYNYSFSPRDEFAHEFFTDWNNEEWNKFDNLMALCAHTYLKHGIINPEPINLAKRKLMDHASPEFVEFMCDSFKSGKLIDIKRIEVNEIFDGFLKAYPEFNSNSEFEKTQNRNKFIKMFCDAYKIQNKGYRSNSTYYFEFFNVNADEFKNT